MADFDKPSGNGTPAEAPDATPPEAIVAIPVRHYGRWISAAVVLVLLALLVRAFAGADVSWDVVGDHLTYDTIVDGARNTLWITVLSMVIGVVLGIALAVMRLSGNPVLASVAWGYIWFFRGTPVLVQLVLWFNLSIVFDTLNFGFYKDETNDIITPFVAALLGLGLNEAAYMAEIARAGILSVDQGQTEAAHALGMNNGKTMRRIVLPQAMRVVIPPTGNEFINMLKTSSLVSVVQYDDLFRAQDVVAGRNLAIMEMLLVATVWYLALTTIFNIGQFYLERHYSKGSGRSQPPTPLQRLRAQLTRFRTPSRVGGTTV
ncbi:amino acid ABC transporter permease [Streptomyces litchfieldiae]|uniref:Amino acid ABC transporter permease n=1 Tax=Streptomyces litchfieldiae TaxID=3075543 RepID=A0ABU2ML35_9ACTN|nr:amino acid ABC transporter permease [Streptomyces sp. DSM 44938]MDT0341633.1 amino acid ABC transporter permease [Streptomyces sp. DSM 44938]